jgi:hypothetical protein
LVSNNPRRKDAMIPFDAMANQSCLVRLEVNTCWDDAKVCAFVESMKKNQYIVLIWIYIKLSNMFRVITV